MSLFDSDFVPGVKKTSANVNYVIVVLVSTFCNGFPLREILIKTSLIFLIFHSIYNIFFNILIRLIYHTDLLVIFLLT
jgi:hypothetical protein